MACKGTPFPPFSLAAVHLRLPAGKMELTIGVSVGSSIQIAAGMIPLLVLIAWPMGKNLTLFFVSFDDSFGLFPTFLVNFARF
jgi:Ca2+/H+ antiporter